MSTALAPITRGKVLTTLETYFALPQCSALMQAAISDKNLSVDRCVKAAIATVLRDEILWDCTPQSVFDCVLAATQLQLVVGKETGHAYILPFKDKNTNTTVATLILGYKGLVTLARRSGEIESIESRVVYKNEVDSGRFDVSFGTNGHVRHEPIIFGDRGEPVGVYMFAKFKSGGWHFEGMSLKEVEAIRARSKASSKGPWVTDFLEMARKTVTRRGTKMLPMTADAADAIQRDAEREFSEARDVTPQAPRPKGAAKVLASIVEEEPPHDPETGEVLVEQEALPAPEIRVEATKAAPAPVAAKPEAPAPAKAPAVPAKLTSARVAASLKAFIDKAKTEDDFDTVLAQIDEANPDLTPEHEKAVRDHFKATMEERIG